MLLYLSKCFIILNGLMFHRIRTYNGVCNNLKKKTMGAALAPYYSLIHPQYGNYSFKQSLINIVDYSEEITFQIPLNLILVL